MQRRTFRDSTDATACSAELPESRWIECNGYRTNWRVLFITSAPVSTVPLIFFENHTGCQSTVESLSRLAPCDTIQCGIDNQPISMTYCTRMCQPVPYDDMSKDSPCRSTVQYQDGVLEDSQSPLRQSETLYPRSFVILTARQCLYRA